MLSEEVVCGCLPNKNRFFINVIMSLFVCFYFLLAKGSNNRSRSSFLFSAVIFVSSFGYDFSSQIAFTPGDVFLSLSVDDCLDTEIMPGVFDDVDF